MAGVPSKSKTVVIESLLSWESVHVEGNRHASSSLVGWLSSNLGLSESLGSTCGVRVLVDEHVLIIEGTSANFSADSVSSTDEALLVFVVEIHRLNLSSSQTVGCSNGWSDFVGQLSIIVAKGLVAGIPGLVKLSINEILDELADIFIS